MMENGKTNSVCQELPQQPETPALSELKNYYEWQNAAWVRVYDPGPALPRDDPAASMLRTMIEAEA